VREADAAAVGAMSEFAAGTELAGYRIESFVGRGGMGVVYRALDLALDRKVALKVLSPELAADDHFRERFLRESRLAASLDHPAIVPVFDAGETRGQLYIAMRLVEGTDLKALLREEGKLEPARALAIVGQVADALDAAHERGLAHRDVKPSNVLVDSRGHAYLADFGLSRRLGEAASELGAAQSLGTVDYVSPEQIRGEELDGRADVYSLGCLLHECLTGAPPFRRDSDVATLFAHLEQAPVGPPGLEAVFAKALAKAPDDRYQTGRELIAAARAALGLEPRRDRRLLTLAAVGTALVAAGLAAFFATRGGGGPAAEPGADRLVRIDPGTGRVLKTIPVGRKASGVAAAGRWVWVTSYADGTVWRVDAKSSGTLTIPVEGSPTGVAAGTGAVLVANGPEHALVSLDPAAGTVAFRTALGGDPNGPDPVAAGRAGLWFADPTLGIAGKVESGLTGGAPSVRVALPPDQRSFLTRYESFGGVAVGDGAVWTVGDAYGRQLWQVDSATRRLKATIRLPFVPGRVAAGEGAVWVTSLLGDEVARVDPATGRVVATIPVGRGVEGIAAG
jgi:outer membrane protein assembly factor BamB